MTRIERDFIRAGCTPEMATYFNNQSHGSLVQELRALNGIIPASLLDLLKPPSPHRILPRFDKLQFEIQERMDRDILRPGLAALTAIAHPSSIADISDHDQMASAASDDQVISVMRVMSQTFLRSAAFQIWDMLKEGFEANLIPIYKTSLKQFFNERCQVDQTPEREQDNIILIDPRNFKLISDPHTSLYDRAFLLKKLLFLSTEDFLETWRSSNAVSEESEKTEVILSLNKTCIYRVLKAGFHSAISFALNTAVTLLEINEAENGGLTNIASSEVKQILDTHAHFVYPITGWSYPSFSGLIELLPSGVAPFGCCKEVSDLYSNTLNSEGNLMRFYDGKYFKMLKGDTPSIPILDFNPYNFSYDELVSIRSNAVRIGCAAGEVNKSFIPCLLNMLYLCVQLRYQ